MSDLPRLHTAEDIAQALGCSKWWVNERARRREIPFVRPGRSYMFTDEHLDEIVAIFEQRPESTPGQVTATPRRRAQPQPQAATSVVRLQARQPRRRPKAG